MAVVGVELGYKVQESGPPHYPTPTSGVTGAPSLPLPTESFPLESLLPQPPHSPLCLSDPPVCPLHFRPCPQETYPFRGHCLDKGLKPAAPHFLGPSFLCTSPHTRLLRGAVPTTK